MRGEMQQVLPTGQVYDDTCKNIAAYAEKAVYQRWREFKLADMALKEAENVVGMTAVLADKKISAKKKANLQKFANNAIREYARYRKTIHDSAINGLPGESKGADLNEQMAYMSISLKFDLWQRERLKELDARTEKMDETVKQLRNNGFSVGVSMEHYVAIDMEENPERAQFYKGIMDSVFDANYNISMYN